MPSVLLVRSAPALPPCTPQAKASLSVVLEQDTHSETFSYKPQTSAVGHRLLFPFFFKVKKPKPGQSGDVFRLHSEEVRSGTQTHFLFF